VERNEQLKQIKVKVIDSKAAKAYTLKHHYMKTFPAAKVCFGVFYKKLLSGVITFGYSTATKQKIQKLVPKINEGEYIEMQRMNLLDVLGGNAESYVLGEIYSLFKKNTNIKVILTHAGGCKNDCGIVYQAASWLYFGKEKCNDFYLTAKGEYKNIIAPMRFGRVPKGIKGGQAVGEYLFGPGELINSFRYLYLYPLQKGLRKYLEKTSLQYPKDSVVFRRNQKWINGGDQ
jgi:hypothetical protein|tara:strand:- start:3628 stop:4320 length:693 start_codon:yes stop_codon:yes gene_type:complete